MLEILILKRELYQKVQGKKMAAKILAACNLQQEPGAISWYVPVVVDQSVQVKPVICIAFILLIHGKRQLITICGLA